MEWNNKSSARYPKRPRLEDRTWYRGCRGYFVTVASYDRQRYFVHSNIVASLVRYLREASGTNYFNIVAYCFMPDHLHIVAEGTREGCNLERFMKTYKQTTAFRFRQSFGKTLWARSYHDHVVRAENNLKDVGRYTLLNPVRAGIVENVLDYPFLGSFVYDVGELVKQDSFLSSQA